MDPLALEQLLQLPSEQIEASLNKESKENLLITRSKPNIPSLIKFKINAILFETIYIYDEEFFKTFIGPFQEYTIEGHKVNSFKFYPSLIINFEIFKKLSEDLLNHIRKINLKINQENSKELATRLNSMKNLIKINSNVDLSPITIPIEEFETKFIENNKSIFSRDQLLKLTIINSKYFPSPNDEHNKEIRYMTKDLFKPKNLWFPYLQEFNSIFCTTGINGDFWETPNLQSISIISSASVFKLKSFNDESFTNLRNLTIKLRDPIYFDNYKKFGEINGKIETSNLENLYLNNGRNVKIKFSKLRNLKSLKLVNCDFEKLENIETLSRLESIDLSFNKVLKLDYFDKLKILKYLNLSNNRIRKIENLTNLSNLETLNLSNNFIKKIENLENLKKLKILSLSNNSIESLENLNDLVLLKEVYLIGNPMRFEDNLINYKKLNYRLRDLRIPWNNTL